MAIRLSGINSGLDTDAIVQELVKAYSLKTEKYEKASTKLTWKQEAWKSLNTKIYGLYTNVSNLRFSSAYNLRKVTVSDNTKASVTASSSSVTGTQKLNILQTAQAAYVTGGQLGKNVTADTTMKELGFTSDTSATIKIQTQAGETKKINITKDMKLSEVVNKFSEAGYNASFDANNKRIFISAKETGAEADFTILGDSENGQQALKALGLNSALIQVDENGNRTFTEEAGNLSFYYEYYKQAQAQGKDTFAYLQEVMETYKSAQETYSDLKDEENSLLNTQGALDARYGLLEKQLLAKRAYNSISSAVSAAEEAGTITTDITGPELRDMMNALGTMELYTENEDGETVVSEEAITKMQEAYAALHSEDGATLSREDAVALAGILEENGENRQTYNDFRKSYPDTNILELKGAEINAAMKENRATYEANEARLAEIETEKATQQEIITANRAMDDIYLLSENDEQIRDNLGKMAKEAEAAARIFADDSYLEGSAIKIAGSDAVIKLNGVEYTSNDNSFSINGLSINAQAVTGAEEKDAITITTNVDTQGIYDKIKDFLTEYNNVINEMCKLYNAESARDYEPLTDEEKEAMSEEQIEKWENKIKDGLLRRDTTLNSIMSAMINSMAQTFEIDGQKLSLSTFGIGTLGFLNSAENENYAYHINGDEDDENTSGKEDKLMAAIEENPDQVVEFMKQLTSSLYTAVDNKMKSTELSSAYKVYNDKEMDKELSKYAQLISQWEEKVSDKEDYYYNKFTQMEKALANLNSQTSSISGLLGQ